MNLRLLVVLIVIGACAGIGIRVWVSGRPSKPAAVEPFDAPAPDVEAPRRSPPGVWDRLLGFLDRDGEARRVLRDILGDWAGPPQAAAPPVPQPPAATPSPVPRKGPAPEEPPAQKAARLWQGGVLATRQGDYAWAIRQFKECLEADPASDGCRAGLQEAQRRLDWNKGRRR
ncbi:MAG: hypothetical protein HY553_15335 [Elusimicrobia bacterium]|nr:hypothetical protein [Elusimicrobiota bacterium]